MGTRRCVPERGNTIVPPTSGGAGPTTGELIGRGFNFTTVTIIRPLPRACNLLSRVQDS